MSEGGLGFLLLVFISSATALLIHWLTRSPWLASAVAAVVATNIWFRLGLYLWGPPGKFFPIAIVVSGFWAFVIALMIGWLFRKIRQPRRTQHRVIPSLTLFRIFTLGQSWSCHFTPRPEY